MEKKKEKERKKERKKETDSKKGRGVKKPMGGSHGF
jgi:hypothetical protein